MNGIIALVLGVLIFGAIGLAIFIHLKNQAKSAAAQAKADKEAADRAAAQAKTDAIAAGEVAKREAYALRVADRDAFYSNVNNPEGRIRRASEMEIPGLYCRRDVVLDPNKEYQANALQAHKLAIENGASARWGSNCFTAMTEAKKEIVQPTPVQPNIIISTGQAQGQLQDQNLSFVMELLGMVGRRPQQAIPAPVQTTPPTPTSTPTSVPTAPDPTTPPAAQGPAPLCACGQPRQARRDGSGYHPHCQACFRAQQGAGGAGAPAGGGGIVDRRNAPLPLPGAQAGTPGAGALPTWLR